MRKVFDGPAALTALEDINLVFSAHGIITAVEAALSSGAGEAQVVEFKDIIAAANKLSVLAENLDEGIDLALTAKRDGRALSVGVIGNAADVLARLAGNIQQGRISVYLTYSFFTLIALLLFVQ